MLSMSDPGGCEPSQLKSTPGTFRVLHDVLGEMAAVRFCIENDIFVFKMMNFVFRMMNLYSK